MAFESVSTGLFAWMACVVVLAGLIQGTLGFGFPFVATPLIAMASDMRTAVIAALLPTLATIVVALAASGPLRATLERFWMMPLYALAGAAAGTALFVAAPHAPYTLLLAAMTLLYLNLDRLGRADWPIVRRHERRFAPLAATAAGLFEGTANIAAPPLIIFYLALGLTPAALVQALNLCFFAGKLAQFTVLATGGGVGAGEWLATLPLAAFGVAGSLIGVRIRRRIDAAAFRLWVKRALGLIALGLIAQYAYSLAA
ncbi:MAG TPA: sulfite exporter TauE/SafE family protein [Burkholderiales bacterium]|nr:sulfite exporter TauE/SafE family protein [Burkholderiales bacterium]